MKINLLILVTLLVFSSLAFARDGGIRTMRRQADSQFRIAEKAYRKAVKDYGEGIEGMPATEKKSACRKMSSALHDNRIQLDMEDMTNQMKYRRQLQKLNDYNSALMCN